ncbi:MAG: TetR family transcriptional regulator [Chloroflexi bacterium]|nr:TetR family transcriptional regulator [Chloroflexota bacterium]
MPRRSAQAAEETRQALLDAALHIFTQDGYEAARLADIAAEAGVTRGALYHHFEGKVGLYTALVEDLSGGFNEQVWAAIGEGGPFLAILERVMVQPLAFLAANDRYRDFYALANFQTAAIDDLRPIREGQIAATHAMVEQVAGFFRMGIEAGDLRAGLDPHAAAQAFIGLQNGLIHMWLTLGQSFDLVHAAGEAARIFIHGVQKETAS